MTAYRMLIAITENCIGSSSWAGILQTRSTVSWFRGAGAGRGAQVVGLLCAAFGRDNAVLALLRRILRNPIEDLLRPAHHPELLARDSFLQHRIGLQAVLVAAQRIDD